MSYCRAGADSDVYAYAHVQGGFAIHVAHGLGKQLDGQNFHEDTPRAFRDRLQQLLDAGYRVPDYAFERIDGDLTP